MLIRRLKLYLIGVVIGSIFVYFVLFRGRNADSWLPANQVLKKFENKRWIFNERQECILNCLSPNKALSEQVKDAKILFSKSSPRKKPYPMYVLQFSDIEATIKLELEEDMISVKVIEHKARCNC